MSEIEYLDQLARKRIRLRESGGVRRDIEWEMDNPEELFADLAMDCARRARLTLDIGCGEGQFALEVSGAARQVVGVDLSGVAVRAAAESASEGSTHFVQADARRLPFAGEVFDLAVSRRGPGGHDLQALKEARRVMAPGAELVALAVGESHRIETQEVFGRGLHWPPVKPVRFAVPEKLKAAGLEMIYFSEYYAATYYPDLSAFAAHLAAIPIIPDFDPDKDSALLREVQRKLTTDRGIRDTEHMAIFVARRQ